jgi:hypothetical protein
MALRFLQLAAAAALLAPISSAQTVVVEDDAPAPSKLARAWTPQANLPTPPLAPTGNDNCALADAIAGAGTFMFNNSAATNGTEGQSTLNCIFYNLIAIDDDVWFAWTASATGRVLMSTCGGTTVDTKIAVYSGPACPGAAATALACNDDFGGNIAPGNFQSILEFDAVAGNVYLLQIGVFPGDVGGVGTFTMTYVSGIPCTLDDGTTENANSITATAGTVRSTCWIHSVGAVGSTTTVTTVSTIWGWTGTGSPLPAGLTGNVAVWEDPNDDGNPNDAVLLAQGAAPMVGQHTDTFQAIPLSSSVVATGRFFIGAWVDHTAGFPAPRDVNGCLGRPFVGWLVGNAGGSLNAANLSGNSVPPFQTTNGNSYLFNLRADCSSGPISAGTGFCFGDGTGTACPCANNGAVGNGCASSVNANGGNLAATGNPSLASDTVVLAGTGMTNTNCLYFQGTAQVSAGAGSAFGDGKRCAGGQIVRLKTIVNVNGNSQYPETGDPPVSVRGLVTAVGTRTYQVWYRNAAAFCTPDTFNLTNGFEIIWTM